MQKEKVGFARPFKTVQNTMTAPSENPLVFSGPLKDPIEQMEVDEEDRPLTVDDIADEQYVCSFSQNVRRMASRAGAYRKGPEWAAMVERMIEQRAFKIMEAMNSGSQARLPALRPSDPYFWQDYGLAMSRPRAVYQGSFSGTLLLDEPASYEELGARVDRRSKSEVRGASRREASQPAPACVPVWRESKERASRTPEKGRSPRPAILRSVSLASGRRTNKPFQNLHLAASASFRREDSSSLRPTASGSQGSGIRPSPESGPLPSTSRPPRPPVTTDQARRNLTAVFEPMQPQQRQQVEPQAAGGIDITPQALSQFGDMTLDDISKHCDVNDLVKGISDYLEGTDFMRGIDNLIAPKPRKKRSRKDVHEGSN